MDALLAQMTLETQAKTATSVKNIERKLEDTIEIADATQDVLHAQGDQVDLVRRDVAQIDGALHRSNKQFNEYESWRIFGGKSKTAAKAAADDFHPTNRTRSAPGQETGAST